MSDDEHKSSSKVLLYIGLGRSLECFMGLKVK